MGFDGLGFRGFGFRVQCFGGSGFGVRGIPGSGVHGLAFWVRVSGWLFGFRVLWFRVLGSGF